MNPVRSLVIMFLALSLALQSPALAADSPPVLNYEGAPISEFGFLAVPLNTAVQGLAGVMARVTLEKTSLYFLCISWNVPDSISGSPMPQPVVIKATRDTSFTWDPGKFHFTGEGTDRKGIVVMTRFNEDRGHEALMILLERKELGNLYRAGVREIWTNLVVTFAGQLFFGTGPRFLISQLLLLDDKPRAGL